MRNVEALRKATAPLLTRGRAHGARMPWCGIWLLVFLIPGEAWSYMDHGGRISRDFAIVDSVNTGGEGGPGSEEALTQWCYDLWTGFQYGPDPEDDGDPKPKSWAQVCLVDGD